MRVRKCAALCGMVRHGTAKVLQGCCRCVEDILRGSCAAHACLNGGIHKLLCLLRGTRSTLGISPQPRHGLCLSEGGRLGCPSPPYCWAACLTARLPAPLQVQPEFSLRILDDTYLKQNRTIAQIQVGAGGWVGAPVAAAGRVRIVIHVCGVFPVGLS